MGTGRSVDIEPDRISDQEWSAGVHILPAGGFRFMLQFERPERTVPETADTLSTANWFHYTGNPTTGS